MSLLEGYLSDLEAVSATARTELAEDKVTRRYVERTLHLAIEACLDIGFHIISAEGYREPRYGREVMGILAEQGWIDEYISDQLQGMAGFRNILVHDYATIETAIVLRVLETRLPDLREFGNSIASRLEDAGDVPGA